jgi:hypothetical protein
MGGYGSGRNARLASKADEYHRLDLATFKSEWFERGWSGKVTWSRGGEPTGSIGYSCEPDALNVSYVSGRGGNRKEIDETFRLSFTDQHFGGRRRWLVCKCGRRCRVLYGGRYFRCRQCHRLCFASQYERFRVPGMAEAETVRKRLGFEVGFAYPFGTKPKGMHWHTYYAYRKRDWAMSDAIEQALVGRF